MNKKIISQSDLPKRLRALRKRGKRVVFTNGCFDIMHTGHTRYLSMAKETGDVLVVGINSDSSTKRLKGRGRPIFGQKERAQVLAALEAVDLVVVFNELDPAKLIKKVRPDVLVKGGDWPVREIVGNEFVKSYGGKVFSLPYFNGHSTTSIIDRIIKLHKGR